MKSLLTCICLLYFGFTLQAQVTVAGTVYDQNDNQPIIGASVLESGTNNGVLTDAEGRFSLTIPETGSLEVRYLGMETKIIKYEGDKNPSIYLETSSLTIDNVIVTAFGIEKSKKASGFAVTEIEGESLTQARDVNIGSQLVGQVAGLEITKPSNGPTSSTRIIIRGLSQFQGENRPLLVVDGVPMDNSNVNTAGLYGGQDSGDGLSSINPDDIENITVLKGPAASSLYGSRAGNGVLLITTKKGSKRKGIGVEYSTNYVSDVVALLPIYQQEYGQGANGLKPATQQEALDNWRSWGGPLDGSLTPIFNGDELPYSPVAGEEMRNYYQTGNTWTNSMSLVGGTDKANGRLSFSKLTNNSIVPNTKYDRYTINLYSSSQISDAIKIEGKVSYSQEDADNRTNLTDNPSNPAKYFTIGPANLPQDVFQQTRDAQGNPIYWSSNPFTLSPYWGPKENVNNDTKRRLVGFVSAKWNILKNVSLQARAATDETNHDFMNVDRDGTQYNPLGSIFISNFDIAERNYDLLLNANQDLTSSISLDLTAGAVRTDRQFQRATLSGSGFINPGFLALNNLSIQRPGTLQTTNSRINGMFSTLTVSLWDYLYIEGSIRRDFFSVLTNPTAELEQDNSITYGSGALSFIASDAFELPKFVNFAKFRLGLGSSGFGQIDPYSQVAVYSVSTLPKETPNGNVTFGNISGNSFRDATLQPSRTLAFEVGTDLSLFKNVLGLEFTYYNQRTDKHIFPSPLPASTGYASYLINSGKVVNSGVEGSANVKIFNKKKFGWTVSINAAKNTNQVLELNEGLDQLNLGVDRTFSANIIARKGGRIGDIWGNVYDRNDQGDIIFGDDGLAQIAEEREILGNFNPDWYGGLTNSIRFGDFNASFLIDTKQGGEILSTTSSFGYLFGTHVKTIPGRDSEDFTIVGEGVGPDGVTPNTTPAKINDYYERISSITEENVYDASYIKFRQLTIGYSLNKKLLKRSKYIHGATISLVGRNLFFFTNGLSSLGLDPESIYTASADDVGIEYSALPSTRSYGVNLQIKI